MSATSSADERLRAERELGELKNDLPYLRVKSRRGDRISDAEREKLSAALTDVTAKLDQQASGRDIRESCPSARHSRSCFKQAQFRATAQSKNA